jgi:cytochrome b561
VTGYAISTSAGSAVAFFDLFDIPAVLPKSEGLRDLAIELHYYLSYGTAILVAIHTLGALKHQFIDQDGTLRRILWSSSRTKI